MNLPEPVGWCHLQYNKDGTSFADCLQHYPDAYADMPLLTEAQLREALASQAEELKQLQEQNTALDAKLAQQEAVMKMALEALNQDVEAYWDGYPYAEAIKALEDALK